MKNKILDGNIVSNYLKRQVKFGISKLTIKPTLAVIMIGNNAASKVYVKNKSKACEEVGIQYIEYNFDENIDEESVLNLINELNKDETINGILVQAPLPKHLNEKKIFEAISPKKDVDGFSSANIGKLSLNEKDAIIPCTPAGIMKILDFYNIEIEGKNVVIVWRSNIVGKPMLQCMLERNATVTICHSKTKKLKNFTKKADILIVAIGKSKFIKKNMIKKNCVIIDVGINRDENNHMCGDVDFENVKNKTSYITPVPYGVGQLTVAMLGVNVYKAYMMQNN